MNLHNTINQITNRGEELNAAHAKLSADAANRSVPMDELERQQNEIDNMQKRMTMLQNSYAAQQAAGQPMNTPAAQEESREVRDMLASREYARAFAYAIQNGLTRKSGRGNEKVKILYDALTESGGTPVGSEGGFLVPEDIDHSIRELKRSLDPLSAWFNTEDVTAPTGWRVKDTHPEKGLVDVEEMGEINDNDDQPIFAQVPYSCTKKALILPVSNELASDNVANLFAYLSRWFAKKLVITENAMLIAALNTTLATPIAVTAGNELKAIKTALNKGLDPAISANADIILNVDAFDALDQLVDDNKRPMLQPDPVNATQMRLKGRPVHSVSRLTLPAPATGKSDIYVGDGREFATLFTCGGFELSSSDIGGNAWRTDSTELRGIARLGVSVFDSAAMQRLQLSIS